MSKVSNKARLTQLKEWMESRGTKMYTGTKPQRKFSKSDHYNKKR